MRSPNPASWAPQNSKGLQICPNLLVIMPTPCLRDFIKMVPVCSIATTIDGVLASFSHHQCDRIIVVTSCHHPLGGLYLNRLLPYLISDQSQGNGDLSNHQRQLPLSAIEEFVIQPLATLQADLTLPQLLPYLQPGQPGVDPNLECAIVDHSGKFIGLLDTQRILKSLLLSSARDDELSVTSYEKLYLASPTPAVSHPLIELLERLPLPVMLQTSSGQVLKQNLAWRQHFGTLQDPDAIAVGAAIWLDAFPESDLRFAPTINSPRGREAAKSEYAKEMLSSGDNRPLEAASLPRKKTRGKTKTKAMPTKTAALEASSLSEFNPCQRGTDPDSCVCICPMANGAERVWQFVKISLGGVLTDNRSGGGDPGLQSFHLAKFTYNNPTNTTLDQLGSDLWLVLAQDVTEQQLVAKELAAKNADLIQLNRLKDEFLACISHELKTPLTAVLGLSSLLKDQLLGELTERQTRYARLIHQSGRHLMTVVNDILDLTRIETGQLELMLTSVEIAGVCDRAYEEAKQIHLMQHNSDLEAANLDNPNVSFSLEIEPGLDTFIADELRLRQMLVHLLSNALKFTDPGGKIGLKVNRWEGWIAFSVWDTGIGIPDPKQHLIFQKFQQLENPLTRQFEGTGLGLVLTQRLAHLHGGDVSFISKEGVGSEFTLLLPPAPPQERLEDGGNTSRGEVSSSRLVLVVEGTTRYIEDLTSKLTELGYRVAIARSGTEALAKARALQPRAIFLNPLLPLLSGWDVLTLLKSNAETGHIPAIVTATMVERKRAYSNRADEFLSLPVQLDALRQILEPLTAPDLPRPEQLPDAKLTILCLNGKEKGNLSYEAIAPTQINLTKLLQHHHYRVLEADDLDQAELLARIWQPHVVILERSHVDPLEYLQQLAQHPALAILPLITLERSTTLAANQVKGLSVFPCLEEAGSSREASALLQAIQVAAGLSWKPNILVVDMGSLSKLNQPVAVKKSHQKAAPPTPVNPKKRTEWLLAMIQYLQTAGFKGAIARSWDEVLRQLQHRSVDLLLIDLGESIPNSTGEQAFNALQNITAKPPIVVLKSQSSAAAKISSLEKSAATILPASVSMTELLDQIRQTLARDRCSSLESENFEL